MVKKKGTGAANKAKTSGEAGTVPNSYFSSLHLRNVRCFGEEIQTLDLSNGKGRPAPWTILLGDNGTGKTTLLQVLVKFSPSPYFARHSAGVDWADLGRDPARRLDRGSTRELPELRAEVATGPALSDSSEDFRVEPLELLPPGGIKELFAESATFGVLSMGPQCYAYGAGRRMGQSQLREKPLDDPTATLFSDEPTLRNAEEWLLQTDYAASKTREARYRQVRDQVEHLLVAILPDVDAVRLTKPRGKRPIARVEFATPYGWVSLRAMSYGYQTLIAWMVDFASRMVERYPDSPDPLAEPAVVLVDEIDLHLHPRWQRILMQYLSERFPNTQFIATAHSPLIVQAAPSVNANIAVLRREGNHVVIDNDVQAARGWRVDQIVASDLFDLPTARPAEYDRALKRRTDLLSKARLSKADQKELAELEEHLGQLPAGDNAADAREMMVLARDTVDMLKEHRGKGK